jgi:hypothetical protein
VTIENENARTDILVEIVEAAETEEVEKGNGIEIEAIDETIGETMAIDNQGETTETYLMTEEEAEVEEAGETVMGALEEDLDETERRAHPLHLRRRNQLRT